MAFPDDYAVLDKLTAADLNKIKNIPLIIGSGGETITISGNPKPVFQDEADGEFYNSDANDTDKLRFDGFLLESTSDAGEAIVQVDGIVDGFTGLTAGTPYFVQDDGTIGTSHGTYVLQVGIARSSTKLEIVKPKVASGTGTTTSGSSSTTDDESIKCGFKPKLIRINYYVQGHDQSTQTVRYFQNVGILSFYGTTKGYKWVMARNVENSSSDGNLIDGTNGYGDWKNPNASVGSVSEGSQGASAGIVASISLNSIDIDGFTIRKQLTAGTGNGYIGIVRYSWEAYA